MRATGRTYSSELSVVGDIKSSLKVLLPELEKATANHRRDYQRRFEKAINEFKLSKESLLGQVQEQQSATVITPLVAAFEAARAIGPDVAIVDEAIATSGSLRKSLNSHRADQYAFYAAVARDGDARGGGLFTRFGKSACGVFCGRRRGDVLPSGSLDGRT